jgi:hypothetical protein
MSGRARMLRGVLVGRVVAAQRHTACLTRSQMNPSGANLYALFAHSFLRLLYGRDCSDVGTGGVGGHSQIS